jgi:hypothetical protein
MDFDRLIKGIEKYIIRNWEIVFDSSESFSKSQLQSVRGLGNNSDTYSEQNNLIIKSIRPIMLDPETMPSSLNEFITIVTDNENSFRMDIYGYVARTIKKIYEKMQHDFRTETFKLTIDVWCNTIRTYNRQSIHMTIKDIRDLLFNYSYAISHKACEFLICKIYERSSSEHDLCNFYLELTRLFTEDELTELVSQLPKIYRRRVLKSLESVSNAKKNPIKDLCLSISSKPGDSRLRYVITDTESSKKLLFGFAQKKIDAYENAIKKINDRYDVVKCFSLTRRDVLWEEFKSQWEPEGLNLEDNELSFSQWTCCGRPAYTIDHDFPGPSEQLIEQSQENIATGSKSRLISRYKLAGSKKLGSKASTGSKIYAGN